VNVALRSSRGLLTTNLALFSGLLQLPIALGMDLLLTPAEHVRTRRPSKRSTPHCRRHPRRKVLRHAGEIALAAGDRAAAERYLRQSAELNAPGSAEALVALTIDFQIRFMSSAMRSEDV
jgi:hypothetical protein